MSLQNTDQSSKIGRQMTVFREKRGYTQRGLAREADVRLSDLEAIETGSLAVEPLQRILGVLGCHLIITKSTIYARECRL